MAGSPPPSPVLSDSFTLLDEDGLSELAGLSDVSDPSSDEDGADEAVQANVNAEASRLRERTSSEGHDFEDITQSMVTSAIAHDEPFLLANNTSDTAPSPTLSGLCDVDELQFSVGMRGTTFSTPTQSTYKASRSGEATLSANTTPMSTSLVTNGDLVYPNPHSDGTSPFGLASSIHSDASLEARGDETLMDMEDASIIAPTGESIPTKRKGGKASRSVHRIRQRQPRPTLSDSLFVDKKVEISVPHLETECSSPSGIETPPADASSNPPALFLKLGAHFSTGRPHNDAAVSAADGQSVTYSTKSGSRPTSLRHGQRWPTILTFGVVGIVVAWAGVTYNTSNAVLSDVLARQQNSKDRTSALAEAPSAPSALPTQPSELSTFVSIMPVGAPIQPVASEQNVAVETLRAQEIPDAVSVESDSIANTGTSDPPGIAEAAERGLATLSSVSSALSISLRRFARLHPNHIQPRCASDASPLRRLACDQSGIGKGEEREKLGSGCAARVVSLDLRKTQLALIPLQPSVNVTCGSLSSFPRGWPSSRTPRKQRWIGTQHQRKKARRLVRYLQETAAAYQVIVKPKRRIAELALSSVWSAPISEQAIPMLEGSWASVFASGMEDAPADEPTSTESDLYADQSLEQDAASEAVFDDLLLLPLSLNQSTFTILPTFELHALFVWLRDTCHTYIAYLNSSLTLDASARPSVRNAVSSVDHWSSVLRTHARHLQRHAQGAIQQRAEGVLAASKHVKAKWRDSQARARKRCSTLHKRSNAIARKFASRISRKLSRHKEAYGAVFKH